MPVYWFSCIAEKNLGVLMQNIKSPDQQRGATTLGMLCIFAVLGLGLYAVIRPTSI